MNLQKCTAVCYRGVLTYLKTKIMEILTLSQVLEKLSPSTVLDSEVIHYHILDWSSPSNCGTRAYCVTSVSSCLGALQSSAWNSSRCNTDPQIMQISLSLNHQSIRHSPHLPRVHHWSDSFHNYLPLYPSSAPQNLCPALPVLATPTTTQWAQRQPILPALQTSIVTQWL